MWKYLVTCVKCRRHSLNVFKCIMSWNTRPNKHSWETQILGCKNWRNSFICTSRRTKRPGEWLRNVEQESVSASKILGKKLCFVHFGIFPVAYFLFFLAASWNMQHMKSVYYRSVVTHKKKELQFNPRDFLKAHQRSQALREDTLVARLEQHIQAVQNICSQSHTERRAE